MYVGPRQAWVVWIHIVGGIGYAGSDVAREGWTRGYAFLGVLGGGW